MDAASGLVHTVVGTAANTNIDLVDCANRHIGAKREFEAKYATGKI